MISNTYKILNSTTGNRELVKMCERLTNGSVVCRMVQKTIPEAGGFEEFLDKEIEDEDLIKIVNHRKSGVGKNYGLSFGDSCDYLPFAFLEVGLRCGTAVCKLKRRCSLQEFFNYDLSIQHLSEELLNELSKRLGLSKFFLKQDYKSTLQLLKEASDEVRRKVETDTNPIEVPLSTAFLVGSSYLLTNYHVLFGSYPTPTNYQESLKQFVVEFRNERNALGYASKTTKVDIDPDFLVIPTKEYQHLDYALIKVKRIENNIEAGYRFGWLYMSKDDKVIAPPLKVDKAKAFSQQLDESIRSNATTLGLLGEPANIIQHPRGKYKETILYSNRVQALYSDFIQYEADTAPGSSAAAVFNKQWQLVALHQAVLIRINKQEDDSKSSFEVLGNLGIRICRIVEDLRRQVNNQELQSFLKRIVDHQRRGRIFITAGRKRDVIAKHDPVYADKEAKQMTELSHLLTTDDAIQAIRDKGFEVVPIIPSNEAISQDNSEVIKLINDQGYQLGDVAIEIYTNYSPSVEQPNDQEQYLRGMRAVYVNNSGERRSHAEMVLQSISDQVPELPSLGAQSDKALQTEGLDFCRKVKAPSLVLMLGFLNNPEDYKIIEKSKNRLVDGIIQGLVRWADSLSPVRGSLSYDE